MLILVLTVLLAGSSALVSPSAAASADPADARLYYAVQRQAPLYSQPADSTEPFARLRFREPLRLVERLPGWCRVRTLEGTSGYVHCTAISNVWIRVSKLRQRVYVYRGTRLVETIKADLGYNVFADKQQRGSTQLRDHWRTPEGEFFVVKKNPNSQFYKAFVLNYPTAGDARRGLKQGLISEREHDAIIAASERAAMPPMDTKLGGWIEIHGDGTGRGTNWTQGCIAIPNDTIDQLWSWIEVGTPVLIE